MLPFRSCLLKILGINMSLVSPLAIGLGIADIVLTYQLLCDNPSMRECPPLDTPQALTWVAVGIWAPIPIFLNGIAAAYYAGKPCRDTGALCVLSFMSAAIFAPALAVISALEVAFKFPDGPEIPRPPPMMPGMTQPPPPSPEMMREAKQVVEALFGIEIALAVIGGVLFLHAVGVFFYTRCCKTYLANQCEKTDSTVEIIPPQPTVQTQDDGDINRMNMWSNNRINNGGQQTGGQVLRSSIYAVGNTPPQRCMIGAYGGGGAYAPTGMNPYGNYGQARRQLLAGGPVCTTGGNLSPQKW